MRRAALAFILTITSCTAPAPTAPSPIPSAAASTPAAAPSATAPAQTAWRRIADIPTPRSELATTVSDQLGRVFAIGGAGGPDRVERYDPAADRWDRAPDLPIAVDHAMAAAVEGLQSSAPQGVFVFGGYLAGGAPTARAFRFDATGARWEELAPMPGPRAAGAAVASGGSIFIVGGADGSRLIAPTYRYDVIAREWRTVAPIPTPRDHLAGVSAQARVCAIGGRQLSLSLNLPALECYDPRADSWTRLPDAPTARGGIGAAEYDQRIYVTGGEQPGGTFRQLEVFDFRTNAWTRGPDLPTPRHGLGVVVIQATKAIDAGGNLVVTPAKLLVIAGGPTPGGSQTATCEALDLR